VRSNRPDTGSAIILSARASPLANGFARSRREIEDAQSVIGIWLDQETLFRLYGKGGLPGRHLFSPAALSHLRRNRYASVLWNLVPGDWRNQGE
jgi:peptidoglycan-N-acetylglucosamine deacetylase